MSREIKITTEELDNKYVKEKSLTLKFDEEKYEELREIAIEVDDTIHEVIRCIVENNLLDKLDDENLKQLVIDAYYDEIF
ncbi:hypothetical protein [uncultured Clostridium sp.]|jgi:hypothetical protein|uniref:hypothetical protein n=1 Tax=uncultured Clostridium sp. TaxID=59620 RepID=UPI0026212CB4|nr:hypothetical protein [uncultured Clostridium sp.]